jgi:acyl-coenzyme A thioesterase PaaI-like protein
MPLVHHELCFGCGRTNLFGLLLEAEQGAPGRVSGRCFVKQDHQGPERGFAHEGIVATALSEAMSLAAGTESRARRIEVELIAPVAVGTFVEVEAECDRERATASATALVDDVLVARATGTYDR